MSTNASVIVAAQIKHTATIIFLHGLGDTGHGWVGELTSIRPPYMKIICPTAETKPVTLNAGAQMPSWFDLQTLEPNGPEDEDGIKRAAGIVHKIIEQENKTGIPSHRIVLGGFSQGGALALYSALKCTVQLAGIIALSCWLPLHKEFPAGVVGNKETPYFQCHGDKDLIVPYKWGQMSYSFLKEFVRQSEFHTYKGMQHESSREEMKDLKGFIERIVPPE